MPSENRKLTWLNQDSESIEIESDILDLYILSQVQDSYA